MAEGLIVRCPECEKKFKPKADVQGKRIKCPFCKQSFVVPPGKGKPDDSGEAPDAPPPPPVNEFDENPDPYAVKHVDMVPRCPNCTQEMGPHDIICLACGYNTLTRQWGKTEKFKGISFGRHFVYLLPGLGAAGFTVFAILFLIFYDTVAPFLLEGTWLFWLDSESMRMWATVIVLSWVFGAGIYCMKRFIEKPKPDLVSLD